MLFDESKAILDYVLDDICAKLRIKHRRWLAFLLFVNWVLGPWYLFLAGVLPNFIANFHGFYGVLDVIITIGVIILSIPFALITFFQALPALAIPYYLGPIVASALVGFYLKRKKQIENRIEQSLITDGFNDF